MDIVVLNELQIRGSFGNPQSGFTELLRLVASCRLKPLRLLAER